MKIVLIILNLLNLATLIPWVMALMMTPMLFDAPNSTKSFMPYAIIVCMFIYPVLVLFCSWKSWQQQSLIWGIVPLAITVVAGAILSR